MSYKAEQAVIGELLTNPGQVVDVADKLSPEMFENALFGRIYFEIKNAADKNIAFGIPYLTQRLQDVSMPDGIIGEEIKNAILGTDTSALLATDAEVVLRDYMAREANKILNEQVDSANVTDQIASIQNRLERLSEKKTTNGVTLSEIAFQFSGDYFTEHDPGTQLGIGFIDDKVALIGGDVCVIAARPAVGKSALATQICTNLANSGDKIGYFNLEMKEQQVFERFMVSASGIGLTRLRRATHFLNDEKERYNKGLELLSTRNNLYIYSGSTTVSEIKAIVKKMKFDVVIIDYLQLIRPDGRYRGNRFAEVGEISHAVKAIAMDFNIPIIVLSQLNRTSEQSATKEPTMSELRESGDIEQDASTIIMLWNLDENDRTRKGCKIDKNRQGELGKGELYFDGNTMRFEMPDKFHLAASDSDLPF